jgi:hypothetical protein
LRLRHATFAFDKTFYRTFLGLLGHNWKTF